MDMRILLIIPPFLLTIVIHEAAHAYTAYRMGDHTARLAGRISLNPIRHLDPVGSVLLPLMLAISGAPVIGWAKPVPVNLYNFRNPRKDNALVSLAGPASNMATALGFALLYRLITLLPYTSAHWYANLLVPLGFMLKAGISVSVYLGLFNLLPVHPLDGSHVLEGYLPTEQAVAYSRLAPYGWIILLALIFTGVLWKVMVPAHNLVTGIIYLLLGL